jgi:hypothetical protein
MGFNQFSKADGIRIVIVLILIAVVYFSFGSDLGLAMKELTFHLPVLPATITPTPTFTATPNPSPTVTPAPTLTFIPTPIPTSAFLRGQVVSFWNEFDHTDLLRGDWVFFPNVKVENGLLTIEHSNDWSGVYANPHLGDGQTVLIQFRFDAWSDLHFAVETGEYETDSYRSWGVGAEDNIFSPVYSIGTHEYGGSFTEDELKLDPGTWYVLMLHIGAAKPFIARIWEKSNPANAVNYEVQLDETWQSQKWLPLFLVGPTGRLEVERYEELKGFPGQ